jgi:DNA repair protein RecN (Recombination protein N)
MLTSLRLSNFAVMEEVEVAFGPGLTVLTGETGAGKSILMDALGLLLGGRAEAEVVRAGADEAVIEGVFARTEALAARLSELGLPDDGPELLIRRTVGRQGRGKAHVNGALVTVGVLGRLMRGQVDIAGQHEHMGLFDASTHLGLVDRVGGLAAGEGPRAAYQEAWKGLTELEAKLAELGGDEAQVAARIDYLAFQLEEIDRVQPKPGEDALLETERRRLASGERLRQAAGLAEDLVSLREGAALELVGRALHGLVEAEKLDEGLAPVRVALTSAQAELDEASRALSRYLGGLDSDPRRLAELDDRLDALRRLCRKHAAPLEAVIAKRDALAHELEQLTHRAERRAEVEAERQKALERVVVRGAALTAARKKAATALEDAVASGLERLIMKSARFEVHLEARAPAVDGCDVVELRFSANAGEPPRPLARVASGGEASRVMLALKAALADGDGCACSVFDEADAGVGGAVADVVGRLIKDVAAHRQVLCITHLPQVAAHADTHLHIEKAEAKGRVRSKVRRLEEIEARAQELARMLSGVEVTREALGAAEALLRTAHRGPVRGTRARARRDAPRRATA